MNPDHILSDPAYVEPTKTHNKHGFDVTIVADSQTVLGPRTRLTSMLCTYPRFIHGEMMTHRVFSRNAASSRAIGIQTMITNVMNHPVIPIHWGRQQKGMKARDTLNMMEASDAHDHWLELRDKAVDTVEKLDELGLHKQIANRLLEPWMWITVLITSSQWSNFYSQRCHEDAEPHMQRIAYMMRNQMLQSTPLILEDGEWHAPFADESNVPERAIKVATGRCARLSYLTFDGKYDPEADIGLHDRLMNSKHWSPFEHCARVSMFKEPPRSNFHQVWYQYRKQFIGECQ